ncbi:Uncharacterised protein [Mycobacteroides abscessus subsp. massiliense]|nr:Uncharacterised protein [Mycobacteroides abscessus subsp. massiliense]SKU96540.1 Uncharacterised protein [Mycobacteroides abscessus subsp. massiliense]
MSLGAHTHTNMSVYGLSLVCVSESAAKFLENRNEKLLDLFLLDESIRERHRESDADAVLTLKIQRTRVCRELRNMGAEPWDLDKARDNSWMIRQQTASCG